MADMSPAAVTQRLRLMGELWELSVKLRNAKKVDEQPDGESDTRIVKSDEDAGQNPER